MYDISEKQHILTLTVEKMLLYWTLPQIQIHADPIQVHADPIWVHADPIQIYSSAINFLEGSVKIVQEQCGRQWIIGPVDCRVYSY
jgi:hypothetical protein